MTSAGKRKPRNGRASVMKNAHGEGGGGNAAPTRSRRPAQRNGTAIGLLPLLENNIVHGVPRPGCFGLLASTVAPAASLRSESAPLTVDAQPFEEHRRTR